MSTNTGAISGNRSEAIRESQRLQEQESASSNEFLRRRGIQLLASNFMACLDLLLLGFILTGAAILAFHNAAKPSLSAFLGRQVSIQDLVLAICCVVLWRCILWAIGVYRQHRVRPLVLRLLVATFLCTACAWALLLIRPIPGKILPTMALFWALSFGALVASRGGVLLWTRLIGANILREKRQVIIVGSGSLAQQLAADLRIHSQWRYNILGFVDSDAQQSAANKIGHNLGKLEDLHDLLMNNPVDEVFIALPLKSQYEQIQTAISLCESAGVQSQYLTNLFATDITKKRETDDGRIVLRMVHYDSRLILKRAFDFTASLLGLLLLTPLLLVVAILVRLSGPGPILFKQVRYGLNKRPFTMYKFRSMVVDAESRQAALEHLNEAGGPVFKISQDPRVTRIGAFIRKTSIDELPQLFNVLFGNMSLVGPRPLPMRDVSRFNDLSTMRRFSVKPGMTGLWQVSGRSNLTFDGWVTLDLQYIDDWSLTMDLRILAMTLPAVLRGKGAS